MHELVVPELELRVLDELDESDEETPGMRPVHDQPLQQHSAAQAKLVRASMFVGRFENVVDKNTKARIVFISLSLPLPDMYVPGDLLLDGLGVGLSEQVEQRAAEVVRVRVRVAQLVRDGVQEQVPTCQQQKASSHF